MNSETMAIENERRRELQRSRKKLRSRIATAKNKAKKIGAGLSFSKKVSEHWYMLVLAAAFDVFGLIPFLGVLFNFAFGAILFLHFGSKKKAGTSDLHSIALPIAIGSVFDFFLGIIPVNIATVLIRIAVSKE